MANCAAADVKVYTGTAISDSDLGYMIADSDKQIASYALRRKVTVDTDTAKQVSILLTRAAAAERFAMTGEAPTSFSAGDYSQSGATDFLSLAKELRSQADEKLREVARGGSYGSYTASSVVRADASVDDFKLDQSDSTDPDTDSENEEDSCGD